MQRNFFWLLLCGGIIVTFSQKELVASMADVRYAASADSLRTVQYNPSSLTQDQRVYEPSSVTSPTVLDPLNISVDADEDYFQGRWGGWYYGVTPSPGSVVRTNSVSPRYLSRQPSIAEDALFPLRPTQEYDSDDTESFEDHDAFMSDVNFGEHPVSVRFVHEIGGQENISPNRPFEDHAVFRTDVNFGHHQVSIEFAHTIRELENMSPDRLFEQLPSAQVSYRTSRLRAFKSTGDLNSLSSSSTTPSSIKSSQSMVSCLEEIPLND